MKIDSLKALKKIPVGTILYLLSTEASYDGGDMDGDAVTKRSMRKVEEVNTEYVVMRIVDSEHRWAGQKSFLGITKVEVVGTERGFIISSKVTGGIVEYEIPPIHIPLAIEEVCS